MSDSDSKHSKISFSLNMRDVLIFVALLTGFGGDAAVDYYFRQPQTTSAIELQTEALAKELGSLERSMRSSIDSLRSDIQVDRRAIGLLHEELDSLGRAQVTGFSNVDGYLKGLSTGIKLNDGN